MVKQRPFPSGAIHSVGFDSASFRNQSGRPMGLCVELRSKSVRARSGRTVRLPTQEAVPSGTASGSTIVAMIYWREGVMPVAGVSISHGVWGINGAGFASGEATKTAIAPRSAPVKE